MIARLSRLAANLRIRELEQQVAASLITRKLDFVA